MVKNNFVFIARRNILVATAHPQQAATLLLDLVHTKFDQTGLPNPTSWEVKPQVCFFGYDLPEHITPDDISYDKI